MRKIPYLAKEGVKNLWHNRTMTFASICVLVACLLLTGFAMLFSQNITNAMQELEGSNQITVYLKDELVSLESKLIGEKIEALENVASVEFVDKDKALEDMLSRLGDDGTLFEGLTGEENFLPDSYRVSFRDLSLYDQTVKEISEIEGVESYTDYSEVAEKLTRLDHLVSVAGFWIVVVLGIVSLFIIANTIRVTMFSRRQEISIMKSVGATNGFIRIPFIIEGICIGIIAGAIASAVLYFSYAAIMDSISGVVPFIRLIPLEEVLLKAVIGFIAAGILFGTIGGSISITRYLKREGGSIIIG